MKVLVISDELKESHKEQIKRTAGKIDANVCFSDSEDVIPDDFVDAEVIYGFAMKTIAKSKSVKWLCIPSAGVDFLLKPGVFMNEDCIITNSAGAFGVSIAEHLIMVSLMLMRQMTVTFRQSISGEWGDRVPKKSLKDSRITVLGTGDIGCTFARRARAFEPASLTGLCRSGISKEQSFDRVLRIDALNGILPETDLLIMCLPETSETKGIMSGERISLLPEGAYVVNVGRGSAIDEDALADNLLNGKLAGAALDVFCKEPLPKESRLWGIKNLIITPHAAGDVTVEYSLDKNIDMFCEDLERYAGGLPLRHLIDKKRGY